MGKRRNGEYHVEDKSNKAACALMKNESTGCFELQPKLFKRGMEMK